MPEKRKIEIEDFFSDREEQSEYAKRVKAMVSALESQWGESYKWALHDPMVKELVRSEMMAFRYERLFANHGETELTPDLLAAERINIRDIRDKLLISLKQVRSEEPPEQDESSPSLFDLASQAYKVDEDIEPAKETPAQVKQPLVQKKKEPKPKPEPEENDDDWIEGDEDEEETK